MAESQNDSDLARFPWLVIGLAVIGGAIGNNIFGMLGSVILGLMGAAVGGAISAIKFGGLKNNKESFSENSFDGLVIALPLQAAISGSKAGFKDEIAMSTKFFAGYLYGFPAYLMQEDMQVGAALLRGLLTSIYGEEEGKRVLGAVSSGIKIQDPQILLGVDAGNRDGAAHFTKTAQSKNSGIVTVSLEKAFAEGRVMPERLFS